jgi:hypothetical protein
MAVTTIGTTGAVWGMTAETGIIVQTGSASINREKNEVRNEVGEVSLVAYFNYTQAYSIEGVVVGTAGIAGAAAGVALTIANVQNTNGVTTGGIYTDEVELTLSNTEFKKIRVSATRYPLIAG